MHPDAVRVLDAFLRVRALVGKKFPSLYRTALNPWCDKVRDSRKTDPRAVMHVAGPGVICTWVPFAARLSDATLAAIFLHEFGHVAGHNEGAADQWVFRSFSLPIEYRGRLKLEWIDPALLKKARLI
jgi:hypothetical protein